MANNDTKRRIRPIYPRLDRQTDMGFFRIAGAGLGNCLYSYFHAYIMSLETGAPLIHPAWPSFKLGPLLRGERSKRFYLGLFRAPQDEINGARKVATLLLGIVGRKHSLPSDPACRAYETARLTVITSKVFTFTAFQKWRPEIRERFTAILATPRAGGISWGTGDHIAAHIRLGDFATAKPGQLESGKVNNIRIPLDWYVRIIRQLRREFPEYPIHIFSDGHEDELADVLAIEGVTLRREDDDVADLIALSEARILVGSHSTYSRWAAFFGDMPTIWIDSANRPEQPSGIDTPILYVGDNTEVITRENLTKI